MGATKAPTTVAVMGRVDLVRLRRSRAVEEIIQAAALAIAAVDVAGWNLRILSSGASFFSGSRCFHLSGAPLCAGIFILLDSSGGLQ